MSAVIRIVEGNAVRYCHLAYVFDSACFRLL